MTQTVCEARCEHEARHDLTCRPIMYAHIMYMPASVRCFCRMASSRTRPELYRVLGISRDALPAEIRQAYLRASKKTHPDVCKEPGANLKFKELVNAYTTLMDPKRRRMYDSGASEEEIHAEGVRSRTKSTTTTTSARWKVDFLRLMYQELGWGDPYEHIERVQRQASEALSAARATPRDFQPAKKFCLEHPGLLIGLSASTLVTSGLPIVLMFTARMVQKLDACSDDLLRPGGVNRWVLAYVWRPCYEAVGEVRRRSRMWIQRGLRRGG